MSDSGRPAGGRRDRLNLIMNGIDAMAKVTSRPRRLLISCERGQGEYGPGVLVGVQRGSRADPLSAGSGDEQPAALSP